MSVPVLVPFSRRVSTRSGGLSDLDRMFSNLFHNAFNNLETSSGNVTDLSVRMNVSETDKAYLISAELPGLEEKDIDLTVYDGLLTLQGQKSSEKEEDGKTWHRVERSYGQFKRVLQLPSDSDENKVTAKMRNGVLEIEIEKLKETMGSTRKIEIAKA
jgi:HSP20 family protein